MTAFTQDEIHNALTAITNGTLDHCRETDDQGICHFLYGKGYIDGVRIGLNRFQLDDIVLTNVGRQYLASLSTPR
ncbi:hypothetical protein [Pseudomonas lini]